MKNMILTTLLHFIAAFSFAQDTSKIDKPENPFALLQTSIAKEKIGKPFLFDTTFTAIVGKQINFTKLKKNTFLYFGMYGCHPCMQELPALVELANEHPEILFVYATHDSKKIIELEQSELFKKDILIPSNFSVIIINSVLMGKYKMIIGYPSRYFLDKNGIVTFFNFSGAVLNSNVTTRKKAMLASIIEAYNK